MSSCVGMYGLSCFQSIQQWRYPKLPDKKYKKQPRNVTSFTSAL